MGPLEPIIVGALPLIVMFALVSASLKWELPALASFIDPMSFLVIALLSVIGLLAAFGSKFHDAMRAIFRRTNDTGAILTAIRLCHRGKSFALAGGGLGMQIGLVAMLGGVARNVSAEETGSALRAGMAIALMSQLYGVVVAYGVFYPTGAWMRRRLRGGFEE